MSQIPSPSNEQVDQLISGSAPASPNLYKSVSHGSQWPGADAPWNHGQGTSYFPPNNPSNPRQNLHSILTRGTSTNSITRRPYRSHSTSSSHATSHRGFRDGEPLSEEDEYRYDNSDQVGRHHRDTSYHGKSVAAEEDVEADDNSPEGDNSDDVEDDPITLKERQSLINVQHPFGLPIWKPALYKKSRSVTRYADQALHLAPSAQAERHLLPGNLFWVFVFGWWLALVCFAVSLVLFFVPFGGREYARLVFGLGWYLAWPFGKYVEGMLDGTDSFMQLEEEDGEETGQGGIDEGGEVNANDESNVSSDCNTVRGVPLALGTETNQSPSRAAVPLAPSTAAFSDIPYSLATPGEMSSLLRSTQLLPPVRSYGAAATSQLSLVDDKPMGKFLGKACFWLAFICVIAPLMLVVCLICWALILTIPMAKLNWALVNHIFAQPTTIRFCAAPPAVIMATAPNDQVTQSNDVDHVDGEATPRTQTTTIKPPRLSPGQAAPSGAPRSTVLLCTYRAAGLQYYKYTVGGVNIMFVNLFPVVFFVIFDYYVLLPMAEKMHHDKKHVPALLAFLTSQVLIFVLSLLSVIPLSYFIGMAVASISAQSSIGMGAVINATFGSIIEIILYGIALTQGKGHLVEGSIVGSLIAGVLLMPGMSMCSSALRRKEQTFNAKSASVTSMMLIMAIIGTLTPTLFYQTYGNFQLVCTGCPTDVPGNAPWVCEHCYYKHPDPVSDPFYQSTVKSLMYFCASILIFSYLIGLWFSLRTHASQIWQNPQPLLHQMDLPINNRLSLYQKLAPPSHNQHHSIQRSQPLQHATIHENQPRESLFTPTSPITTVRVQNNVTSSPTFPKRVSIAAGTHPNYTPLLESVDHAVKNTGLQNMELPPAMTPDDFTRAVTVATVSALRHQQAHAHSPARLRNSTGDIEAGAHGGHGGHDAPNWSRTTSASVLLGCTALYAVIAELLVGVVDVVLQDSGIDEKFLGVTLFALVPNTTEFMNAISFALNGNIALSMEIGSAYALQVCLLQIPAMVAFSAWHDPEHMGEVARTFSLIFPRWDVVVIILSMFLLTYTYIEAKSNYHRGSILILSYLVLVAGFYFAPPTAVDIETGHLKSGVNYNGTMEFPALGLLHSLRWYIPSL